MNVGDAAYKFGDDFVAFTGAQTEKVNLDADLVFVGYGIDAPEQKWNDYKGSAEDYRGKILVMMVNDPPATAAEPNLFGGKALTYYGRWTYKFEASGADGRGGRDFDSHDRIAPVTAGTSSGLRTALGVLMWRERRTAKRRFCRCARG